MFDFISFIAGIAIGVSATALIVGSIIFQNEQRKKEQEAAAGQHFLDVEEIITGHTNY